MVEILIYPITPTLWRWEVRVAGALLRCGTAATKQTAESEADEVVNA